MAARAALEEGWVAAEASPVPGEADPSAARLRSAVRGAHPCRTCRPAREMGGLDGRKWLHVHVSFEDHLVAHTATNLRHRLGPSSAMVHNHFMIHVAACMHMHMCGAHTCAVHNFCPEATPTLSHHLS